MVVLDEKQIHIFAKALMPELYEIQARFDAWDQAIQDVVKKNCLGNGEGPFERPSGDGMAIASENQEHA